ncbi:YaaA family protein [Candidatus Gracilibacteria bacterium]|nr:YaaA family protein [Candidatus Gracilibacteria bacterium]
MKIIYLIPPSEGKNNGGISEYEKLSFNFKKPLNIAISASQKDLKCIGKRFEEGIELNKNINSSGVLAAIERYSGVMYSSIDYVGMSESGKKYFEDNFIIVSGMYGLIRPLDSIGNYKLPIETKGLKDFWGESLTHELNNIGADIIIDLLPNSYKKVIQWNNITSKVLSINFYSEKKNELKKITHGVKKIKGEYIHTLCNKGSIDDVIVGNNIHQELKIIV